MTEDEKAKAGVDDRPGRTLWVVRKDGRSMACLVSGQQGHEHLQVLLDGDVYLDETHTVHDGAVNRARTLLRGFEAHGWTPVVAPPPGM